MNDYYDVRLKQANLEYLFDKYSTQCTGVLMPVLSFH